jgi:peptide/nickel transport system substrate-binding protein
MQKRSLWLVMLFLMLALVLVACGGEETPATDDSGGDAAADTSGEAADTTEAADDAAAGCPASTVADTQGLEGDFPKQFELDEYEAKAGCTLTFSENPDIASINEELNPGSALPDVADRIPDEPLVVQPYNEIGRYGGRLRSISKSPESGTSDFLSTRHVNLVRFDDDMLTIVPNIATGWEYNDDFTELTFYLREGHKWSDGEPFTAEDIDFWYNDIKRNSDLYEEVSSLWVFGGEPMEVEAIDDTTVKFSFAAPAPNFVTFMATTYIQPFQPKHALSQFMPKYNPDADANAQAFGFDDWTGQFKLYFHDWKDTYHPFAGPDGTALTVPTLESHILVEETTDFRRYIANPYFHQVDTVGNQLPYYNEAYEIFSEDIDVTILKLINGELDYRMQTLELPRFPELKLNEEEGGYRVFLPQTVGEYMYYTFNITHEDPEMAKIFGDLRFRQAMSLAINREEIKEIVYLGQGTPQQALPIDYSTVDFIEDDWLTQFTEYDTDAANALLDEMGLTERDSDGFRLRFDGEPFIVLLQYAPQGGPVQNHELVKGYWEAVGVRVQLKEVTSDFYRTESSQNRHDIATWRNGGGATEVAGAVQILVPPFGDFLDTRTGTMWNDWMTSDGAEGIEPPDDVKPLWTLAEEWKSFPIGSAENSRIGAEIVAIHAKYLFQIGLVGDIPSPMYVNNRVGNFGEFTLKAYPYYWTYPFRPTQWFIDE